MEPQHSAHSSGDEGSPVPSEVSSSSDDTPSNPCSCGDRWILAYQADRIAKLDGLCQQLLRDKAKIKGRKDEYKELWRFSEDEMARFVDEQREFEHDFTRYVPALREQLHQIGDLISPPPETAQPTPCCALHATQVWSHLEEGNRLLDRWVERTDQARAIARASRLEAYAALVRRRGERSDGRT